MFLPRYFFAIPKFTTIFSFCLESGRSSSSSTTNSILQRLGSTTTRDTPARSNNTTTTTANTTTTTANTTTRTTCSSTWKYAPTFKWVSVDEYFVKRNSYLGNAGGGGAAVSGGIASSFLMASQVRVTRHRARGRVVVRRVGIGVRRGRGIHWNEHTVIIGNFFL